MVQLSPDTPIEGWDGCSGYHYSDSAIVGFSHTHLSGTGCGCLGDILLMPTVGDVKFNPEVTGRPFRTTGTGHAGGLSRFPG
jgi:putative alpha-1,2-mannosidase